MSPNIRQSRSKSRSPRNSISSSRRGALHARSDSDTNELAGKRAAAADEDQVYNQSPFPRLPSQVLSPKQSLSIFEDRTATAVTGTSATSRSQPPVGSRIPRAASPKGRVKAKSLVFNDADPAASSIPSRQMSKRLSNAPTVEPLRAHPVQRDPTPARTGRANSRVRSIVSAIESAKGDSNDSQPPTPKPPTPKSRVIRSPRFSATHAAEESVPVIPPILPQFEPLASQIDRVQSPSKAPTIKAVNLSSAPVTRAEPVISPSSTVSHVDQLPSAAPQSSNLQPSPSIGDLSIAEDRPRSASTPTAPTDAFLAALVSEGTVLQYPKLEKRSVTSLRTDTSSIRGAFPRPLALRRKRARSHLSRAESVTDDYYYREASDVEDPSTLSSPIDDRPHTPPRIIEPDSGRWTPGRWTAELEDTVAPLDRHPLRAQHSYYRERERNRERDISDSRPTSKSSMESISSAGGFYRFLNDSRTAWAKSYYCNEGALRLVTPPHVIQLSNVRPPSTPASRSYAASGSGPTQTPESESFVEDIYIPRARPLQRRPPDDEFTIRPASSEEALPPSRVQSISSLEDLDAQRSSSQSEPRSDEPAQAVRRVSGVLLGPVPRPRLDAHLSPDRGVSVRYSLLQAPSLDGTSWRSPVNMQVGLFIFGIIFPFAWMIAACLPLPPRPHFERSLTDADRAEVAEEVTDVLLQEDVKRWQKVRWWRNVNRFMSFTGLCVIATIIALAIVGTH